MNNNSLKQFIDEYNLIIDEFSPSLKQIQRDREFGQVYYDKLDGLFDRMQDRFELVSEVGSYRIVFGIGNSYVLKLDNNPLETFRNGCKDEIKALQCLGNEYAPKLVGYDQKRYHWLLAERVNVFGLDKEEVNARLRGLLGLREDHSKPSTVNPLTFFFTGIQMSPKSIIEQMARTNKWYRELLLALKRCNIATTDFRPANLGYRGNDDILFIDLGLPGYSGGHLKI